MPFLTIFDREVKVGSGKYKLKREKIGGYQTYTLKGIKLRLVPLVDLIKIE